MISQANLREQTYSYFLTEAQDLLQSIEQNLLSLREERSPAKVHSLMRSAHTLKGAAASVGFESMKTIAHSLEDVFKALYKPEVEIDSELEALLFEGYECLRMPVTSAVAGTTSEDAELLERSNHVFARIRSKLGNHFDPGAAIPTSSELGFDITQSLFETGVRERLEQLAMAIAAGDSLAVAESLQIQAEVFVGLGESLNLPGFRKIAQATLTALKAHPDRTMEIAQAALADFRQGQISVLGGDRSRGGEVSETLQQLAGGSKTRQKSSQNSVELKSRDRQFLSADEWKKSWNRFIQFLNRPLGEKTNAPTVPSHSPEGQPTSETTALTNFLNTPGELGSASLESALEELANQFDQPNSYSSASGLADLGYELWDEPSASIEQPIEQRSPSIEANSLIVTNSSAERGVSMPVTIGQEVSIPVQKETIAGASSAQTTTVRVDLEHLESLNYTTSELLIHQNRQTLQDERLQVLLSDLIDGLKAHQQTMMQLREWADWSLVSPERPVYAERGLWMAEDALLTRFDALELDRHNELHVKLQSALEELVQIEMGTEAIEFLLRESSFARNRQGLLLKNLRDDLLTVRMIPVATVVNRFPRVVQQLMETYGKQVELRLVGTQVLVDKAVAEKLYDPLLHLIRNAFDHGIEPLEVRCQKGKSEVGLIEVRAYQQGNRTLIEVRDDGQGLDLQRICRRGFEMKLLPSDQVKQFSQTELLNLLFEPGFSTTTQVNELSGRGVGLDVVRSQMQSLRGNMTITSDPNYGTTFSLQLPLTLMSARLLVCQVGQTVYGLLSDEVERILTPEVGRIEISGGKRLFHWRYEDETQTIPVYPLSGLLSYTTSIAEADSAMGGWQNPVVSRLSSPILLFKRHNAWIGIEVDRILGEQELVIRPMGNTIAPPSYVYGCSVLGDGRLMLVIDGLALSAGRTSKGMVPQAAEEIVGQQFLSDVVQESNALGDELALGRVAPSSIVPTPPPPVVAKPNQVRHRILVIDDSVTLRQMLTITLQGAGYEVIQAQDGLEAIEQLQKHSEIQLITCDVEMPRLNGFEFLMRYSQEPSLAKAPVVMLTSRSNEKHKQLAVQLGATDYMTKPFAEDQLLHVVDELILRRVSR